MMNRAYEILPDVDVEIDWVLGESVRADYDFDADVYRLVPDELYERQVSLLQQARERQPRLRVLTLDYWDPDDLDGIRRIYEEQRANGFVPYVATLQLDRIVPEPPEPSGDAAPPRGRGSELTRLAGALLWALTLPASALALDPMAAEPRVVLALYDGAVEEDIRHSLLHSRFELPLNHLGLILRYHDVREPMPALDELGDVRGSISWLHETIHGDPVAYLAWLSSFLDSGRRVVIVGELGATPGEDGVTQDAVDALWARLGLSSGGDWVRMTYDLEVIASDDEVVGFERKLGGVLPGYPIVTPVDDSVTAHLTVARRAAPDTASTLVATGSGGGFIAPGYALWAPDETTQQWLVNPFRFCRLAFATDEFPKPDTTTISGRRIFYSHIDGDGWRNRSLIPAYRKQRALSAEVVYRELLVPFPDLPVSVAPVVGDLDPAWHGSAVTLGIARDTFALPHVEAGSHTYSHPLDWGFFAPDGGATAVDPSVGKGGESWLDPVTGWVKTTILGEEEPVTWNADRRGVRPAPELSDRRLRSESRDRGLRRLPRDACSRPARRSPSCSGAATRARFPRPSLRCGRGGSGTSTAGTAASTSTTRPTAGSRLWGSASETSTRSTPRTATRTPIPTFGPIASSASSISWRRSRTPRLRSGCGPSTSTTTCTPASGSQASTPCSTT